MTNSLADSLIALNDEGGRKYRTKDGLSLVIKTNDYSYDNIFTTSPEGYQLEVLDWRTYKGGARCAICQQDIPEVPG